jgi:hypothetical protein
VKERLLQKLVHQKLAHQKLVHQNLVHQKLVQQMEKLKICLLRGTEDVIQGSL